MCDQSDHVEQFRCARGGLLFGCLLHVDHGHGDVAQRRDVWEQIEPLEHHADVAALAGGLAQAHFVQDIAPLDVADQLAVDVQPPGVDLLEMVDAAQEGGLARTRRSDQAHHLAGLHAQGDTAQNVERTEALVDVLGINHGRHLASLSKLSSSASASACSCRSDMIRDAPRAK